MKKGAWFHLLIITSMVMGILAPAMNALAVTAADVPSDNFDASTLWSFWSTFGTATITTNNRVLNMPVATTNNYHGIQSTALHDLTGKCISLKIVSNLSQYSSIVSLEVYALQLTLNGDSNNQIQFAFFPNANQVRAYYHISGATIQVGSSLTMNDALYRYVRICENGGTIKWDSSPDGFSTTWTNRFSSSTRPTFSPTSTLMQHMTGTWQVEAQTPVLLFDDFNIIQPLMVRPNHLAPSGGVGIGF